MALSFGGSHTRVCVGAGILGEIGALARSLSETAFVVTDRNVADLYAAPVTASLEQAGIAVTMHVIPPGDACKTLDQANDLYTRLADAQIGRDGLIVAVGGGVVTDLSGFVGATWMRGIATCYVPTTLEADIDACIGGKTGVNHPAGKNLIGAFHHPRLVLIDTDCLDTLSDRDLRAGLAESVKHAAIDSEEFLDWHALQSHNILTRDPATTATLIEKNLAIKASVVTADERETSDRRVFLNYGHTIGHAIEAEARYELRHGECVSLGMVAANAIAVHLGMLETGVADRIRNALIAFDLPVTCPVAIDPEAVWSRLVHDKKAIASKPRFVLIHTLGNPTIHSQVPDTAIQAGIHAVLTS